MTEKVLIVSMENNRILATRIEKDECASCAAGCSKKDNSFEISNPAEIKVSVGSIAIIRANKKIQAVQGIISLMFPFLCAVAGYISAPHIMSLFGKTISDDARAVFVLLFLFVSSAIVFIVTRKYPVPGKPEIAEVL